MLSYTRNHNQSVAKTDTSSGRIVALRNLPQGIHEGITAALSLITFPVWRIDVMSFRHEAWDNREQYQTCRVTKSKTPPADFNKQRWRWGWMWSTHSSVYNQRESENEDVQAKWNFMVEVTASNLCILWFWCSLSTNAVCYHCLVSEDSVSTFCSESEWEKEAKLF